MSQLPAQQRYCIDCAHLNEQCGTLFLPPGYSQHKLHKYSVQRTDVDVGRTIMAMLSGMMPAHSALDSAATAAAGNAAVAASFRKFGTLSGHTRAPAQELECAFIVKHACACLALPLPVRGSSGLSGVLRGCSRVHKAGAKSLLRLCAARVRAWNIKFRTQLLSTPCPSPGSSARKLKAGIAEATRRH